MPNIKLTLILLIALITTPTLAQSSTSTSTFTTTRITSAKQTARTVGDKYPHRAFVDTLIKRELDLKPTDTLIDIGAGDGWWTERFAKQITQGTIHALEVTPKLVTALKTKFASNPHIKPFLGQTDSTTLPNNTCDVAFFSQVYHHLSDGTHTDYLKHLTQVVKPTGRLVIIEKYSGVKLASSTHGTQLSKLITQAENAGWVPMRIELLPKTYHYIAIFGQKQMFPPEPQRKKSNTPKK